MFAFIISLIITSCSGKKKQKAQQVPEIPVITAESRDVPIYIDFVGQINGKKDIPIRARVEGFLESINFKEGSFVKKGQLLYTIDPQALLELVSAKQSEVAAAKTSLVKAEADLKRIKPLAKINAVSQRELDAAQALYEAAVANLEAAKANLRSAEINLSYTKVYSPIDGIIGKTKARVGEFVGREPNPVILNTVSSIDTVRVDFSLTEKQYLLMTKHSIKNNQRNKKDSSLISIILADGEEYSHKGNFDFIDRSINQSTGSMLVQASFPNPDGLLRPGMNCTVKVLAYYADDAIVIPHRCLMELQGYFFVYVVNDSNTVVQRKVNTSERMGDIAIVEEGLKAGEKIVFEALQKVRPGINVIPVDTVFHSKAINTSAN
jgi:membrane fusion protein (multidrug efflux system)